MGERQIREIAPERAPMTPQYILKLTNPGSGMAAPLHRRDPLAPPSFAKMTFTKSRILDIEVGLVKRRAGIPEIFLLFFGEFH
jgi:hypothetical protein